MTAPCFKLVAVGGTFDRLHVGHKYLLNTTFKVGENVIIGVTSDEMASSKGDVEKYDVRVKKLTEYLESKGYNGRYEIFKLDDPYGPALRSEELEAIVVSTETYVSALRLNELRYRAGLKRLIIVVCPLIYAVDGKPISSTRIRMGVIDDLGRKI